MLKIYIIIEFFFWYCLFFFLKIVLVFIIKNFYKMKRKFLGIWIENSIEKKFDVSCNFFWKNKFLNVLRFRI